MTVTELVFFLEERSAKAMLEGFLPKLLPDNITTRFIVFEGKSDLEKNLPRKLRAWCNPQSKFVVLRDQDSGNCTVIKKNLIAICNHVNRSDILIRIACRELESWYVGDLKAVETGLNISGLAQLQMKQKFRTPDNLNNVSEELYKLTENKYQKVSGSRAIGPHLAKERNLSHSFQVFIAGIESLLKDSAL